jgi:hypothetical protein
VTPFVLAGGSFHTGSTQRGAAPGGTAPRTSRPYQPYRPYRPHGGAGNRTLVRICFQNSRYVRRPGFLRLPCPVPDRPCGKRAPRISLAAAEQRGSLARFFDSAATPQAGFVHRRSEASVSSAYAAIASSELAVGSFQAVLPGTWTWARSHSFTKPVEASRPRVVVKIRLPGRFKKRQGLRT